MPNLRLRCSVDDDVRFLRLVCSADDVRFLRLVCSADGDVRFLRLFVAKIDADVRFSTPQPAAGSGG